MDKEEFKDLCCGIIGCTMELDCKNELIKKAATQEEKDKLTQERVVLEHELSAKCTEIQNIYLTGPKTPMVKYLYGFMNNMFNEYVKTKP